jgi:D-lyxose ketol-isomerase
VTSARSDPSTRLSDHERALGFLSRAGVFLTAAERSAIEVADFGLDRFREIGLQLFVYVNTDRCCAKELVILPGQICPEHRHPAVGSVLGKEETFRIRLGSVLLYREGEPTQDPAAVIPDDLRRYFTVWHECRLERGDQITIPPDTLHWFQGGPDGAVVTEFSTRSTDESDVFTDPRVVRVSQPDR